MAHIVNTEAQTSYIGLSLQSSLHECRGTYTRLQADFDIHTHAIKSNGINTRVHTVSETHSQTWGCQALQNSTMVTSWGIGPFLWLGYITSCKGMDQYFQNMMAMHAFCSLVRRMTCRIDNGPPPIKDPPGTFPASRYAHAFPSLLKSFSHPDTFVAEETHIMSRSWEHNCTLAHTRVYFPVGYGNPRKLVLLLSFVQDRDIAK